MSSEQPYNSLGQILASGGEIALGLAMSHGVSPERIQALFARRFDPLQPNDRATLEQIARAGVAAGEMLSGLAPGESIPIHSIPINPNLFGDEPAGRRIKIIGEWQFPNSEQWIETRLEYPDLPTLDQILEDIINKGRQVGNRCHDKFGLPIDEPVDITNVRITFTERRF